MAILLSRGTPVDACDRCGTPELPISIISDPDENDWQLRICILCLAEAIDVPTGWNNVANVLLWLRRSDVSQRFRNPLMQLKRGRHRKLAPVGERFHQQQLEEQRNAAAAEAPADEPPPVQRPGRAPGRRSDRQRRA